MKTYILFIYGIFGSNEDVNTFCNDVIGKSTSINELKYVIDNMNNVIVIFDSNTSYKKLSDDLFEILLNDKIKLYFLFEQKSLVSAHLPEELKNFMFKSTKKKVLNIEFVVPKKYDLDVVLEKIKEHGISSLTSDEKNFLDNVDI